MYTVDSAFPYSFRKEILYNEGGETLERVAQRGSGGPIPGNIQDHVGQGSEQPDLVSSVAARFGGGWTK